VKNLQQRHRPAAKQAHAKPSVSAPSHKTATSITFDLGDKKHTVCVLNVQGKVLTECTLTNTREALQKLSADYPVARKVRAIYQKERKRDALDAMMLARIGRMDPRLLHPVTHRSEPQQPDFLQINLRDDLWCASVSISSAACASCSVSLGVRLASFQQSNEVLRRVDARVCDP
jgi:hypothetical protein